MHPIFRVASVVLVALAALLCSGGAALASGRPSVIVRVEGESRTLVGPVQVLTPEAPVGAFATPEDTCPGDSGLGALAVASGGDWGGKWEKSFGQYAIESIAGESHAFKSGSFWGVWYEHRFATIGLCKLVPESGSEILLAPCPEATECPTPLAISAPAVVYVGAPVTVQVIAYNSSGVSTAVSGATVSGGTTPVTTAADGSATVTFSGTGVRTLAATAPGAVRDETQVCVNRDEGGLCGTASCPCGPGGGPPKTIGNELQHASPDVLVAKVAGIRNGATYPRSRAPRLLAGKMTAGKAVTSVSLELRRNYHGHCSYYDGARARFTAARCGKGRMFSVSSGASFSYLLPKRLGPGRYVLEISGLDAGGARLTPTPGSSKLDFRVR